MKIVNAVRGPFTSTPAISEPVADATVLNGDHVVAHPHQRGVVLVVESSAGVENVGLSTQASAVCSVELLEDGHGIHPLVVFNNSTL